MKYGTVVCLFFVGITTLMGVTVYAAGPMSPESRVLACQDKEGGIKQRSLDLTKNTENTLLLFQGIATRVKTYYDTTTLPSGKIVGNYDVLTTNIDAKQQAVALMIAKAQEGMNSFGCTAADPREQIDQFQINMQAVKQGLTEYREAIKILILAINAA